MAGGDIETSWLGIGLTLATLGIRQPLGLATRRLGAKLASTISSIACEKRVKLRVRPALLVSLHATFQSGHFVAFEQPERFANEVR